MAISKYVFTGTSITAQASEMLAWLQANATDFFDTISMASNIITCSKDSTNALVLGFDGSAKNATLTLENGSSIYVDGKSNLWEYAIKTSNCILLKSKSNSAPSSFQTYLYITKSNNNSLIIAVTGYCSNSGHFYCGDIFNSSEWDDVFGSASQLYNPSSYRTYWGITSSLTTLTPICITSAGTYAPDIYIMRFCEYPQTEGRMTIGGVDYFSTGYLALKG